MFIATWTVTAASKHAAGQGQVECATDTEVDVAGETGPFRQHSSDAHEFRRQVDTGRATTAFGGEIARDAAKPAADIEDPRALGQTHHPDDMRRRGAAAHVELVDRGEIDRRQGIEIKPGALERVQNPVAKTADIVVIGDRRFPLLDHSSTGPIPAARCS